MSEQIAILALALLAYAEPSRSAGTDSSRRSPAASCSAPPPAAAWREPVRVHRDARTVRHLPGVVDLRRAVRRRAAHPRALRSTHRLRDPEPHRDQDGAGRDRAGRNASATGHRGVHGLVRPARAGLGRLHAHRPGGVRAWRRRCDARADRHVDHPALRGAARHLRSPLAARYGASIAQAGDIPEKAPAGEPRIRLHDLAGRRTARTQDGASVGIKQPVRTRRPADRPITDHYRLRLLLHCGIEWAHRSFAPTM